MYTYPPFSQPAYPQAYYGQPMPQPMGQLEQLKAPYQQPQAQPPAETGVIWVQGEAGAKSYPVARGSKALLMDSEGPTFYLKSVDAAGIPTMDTYDYTKRDPIPAQPQAPATEYAPRADLDRLTAQLDALTAEVERLKTTKRAKKSTEVTDDAEPVV